MDWITSHGPQMIALVIGGIFIWGSKQFEPHISRGKLSGTARWIAFGMSVVAGLLLGYGLYPVVQWLTGLGTIGGAIVASIGSIVAVTMGWQAVYLIIAATRDLLDKIPDGEARKAARWVPTFLPAGGAAIMTLLSNPRVTGFGLGVSVITAVIISGITMAYTFKIFNAVDLSKSGLKLWKYFAVAVAFVSGFIHIALVAYLDSLLGQWLPAGLVLGIRVIGGTVGIVLMICAVADFARDMTPDKHVRQAGVFGVPLLFLFFSLAMTHLNQGVTSGLQLLTSGG